MRNHMLITKSYNCIICIRSRDSECDKITNNKYKILLPNLYIRYLKYSNINIWYSGGSEYSKVTLIIDAKSFH